MPQPTTWIKLSSQSQSPNPRLGHSLVQLNNNFYILFGGLDNERKEGRVAPNNQVFTMKILNNNSVHWHHNTCQGQVPLPRSNHGAVAIDKNKMVIFGGLYTSNLRFNDVYILTASNNAQYTWEQPSNHPEYGQEPKSNNESKIGAPEPRANMTMTYIKENNKIYVIGGHGGINYSRKAFDDVHSLDITTWEWKKLDAQGATKPLPRGGHVAALLPNTQQIFVYGGWSSTTQHADCFIYDAEQNTWIETPIPQETPRWNLCSAMVTALPENMIFCFGGSSAFFDEVEPRNFGQLLNKVTYIQLKDKLKGCKWQEVELEDEPQDMPLPRENAAMCYDQQSKRLIVVGGWTNNYSNEVYILSISKITGPDYAIYGIEPVRGPYTGETPCIITGEGFKESNGYQAKFGSGKYETTVSAQFKSEKELVLKSPNFHSLGAGPREATVHVKQDGQDYTITSIKFNFFLNTRPENTIVFGPGLLNIASSLEKASFTVQARNMNNENRTSGSDEVKVEIFTYQLKDPAPEDETEDPEEKVPLEDVSIEDHQDGQYTVFFKAPEGTEEEPETRVWIDVKIKNEQNQMQSVKGLPQQVTLSVNNPPENNDPTGPTMIHYINDTLTSFQANLNQWANDIDLEKNESYKEDVKVLLSIKSTLQQIDQNKEHFALELAVIEQALNSFSKSELKNNEVHACKKAIEDLNKLLKQGDECTETISPTESVEKGKTENLMKDFEEELKHDLVNLKKKDVNFYDTGVEKAFKTIEEIEEKIEVQKEMLNDFKYYSDMFNIAKPENAIKNLETIERETAIFRDFWEKIKVIQDKFEEYKEQTWDVLDAMEMQDQVKTLQKELNKIKIERKKDVYRRIQEEIKQWFVFLPLISDLKSDAMIVGDDRHWNNVREQLNQQFTIDEDTTLKMFWDFELYLKANQEIIEEITETAKAERKIENQLKVIAAVWKGDPESEVEKEKIGATFIRQKLQLKKDSVNIIKMDDDDVEKLEDHQLQIANIAANKYMAHFEDEVNEWQIGLGNVNDSIRLLSEVQKTWSFLINLFLFSDEVAQELPGETEDFKGINADVRQLLEASQDIENIFEFSNHKFEAEDDQDALTVMERLEGINSDLTLCQNGLNDFIASKRKVFPRFYFLTMEELLDILANGNNPILLFKQKNYMNKIVQAGDKLEMTGGQGEDDKPTIISMKSAVGIERLVFDQGVVVHGKVETYLNLIIKEIGQNISNKTKKAIQDYKSVKTDEDLTNFITVTLAQINLLISGIDFSQRTEAIFAEIQKGDVEGMKKYLEKVKSNLVGLIRRVQGKLDPAVRKKIMCLITMETHNRDVIIKLIDENVRKAEEFQWQSLLKIYWEKETPIIKIADAILTYGFEYLGNGARLVVTPLTDRIYVTATQALHLKMGCAPAGPAGTGKTETTKDLASAVGKACYVFNCSGEMDYQTMGNIFKGLASSGCWGCFDEFNRLVPEVLSVCSVQFKSVTDAIKVGDPSGKFTIEGDRINLDPSCGAFITMNPGYLGRAELPEGLKALFRPITVVVPDLELICENILMAEGFQDAKDLARKFVTLYSLCKDLLSKQMHYDWGLRAIKSVLVVAGEFKRGESDIPEINLLFRALRDFNYPKIAQVDFGIFNNLLADLFPGIDIPRKQDEKFEKCVFDVAESKKYTTDADFMLKIVQLYELLEIRHCVFIMGPPGAGKTTTWRVLADAQGKFDEKLKTTVQDLDPKVFSTSDLYGENNLTTKEWKNGLLSHYMQYYSEEVPDECPKWIVLDGDLDANWIESMNSVMDDNKLLTLANNGRIILKNHMKLLFEIRDLVYATPATVSRAGILFISDDKGYQRKCYMDSWIERFVTDPEIAPKLLDPEELREILYELANRFNSEIINLLYKNYKFVTVISYFSMVMSLTKMLDFYFKRELHNFVNIEMLEKEKEKGSAAQNQKKKHEKQIDQNKVEHLYILCCVWAFGGALTMKDNQDYRKMFSGDIKNMCSKNVRFGSGTVYDYFVSFENNKVAFVEWKKMLEREEFSVKFDPTQAINMNAITVPIPETVSVSEITKGLIFANHPVLFIGQAGSGKTQLSKGLLQEIRSRYNDQFYYSIINFNYYTDSNYLQTMLEQDLVKQGNRYGPKKGQKMKLIYFIDDLNMPQLDPYNTQTSIALLRQHIDYSHWYDISKAIPVLKNIINTQVIAAMNPTSGSFHVNPRYQRHFWTSAISFPENQSLQIIYDTFLKAHFSRNFKSSITDVAQILIKAAMTLHSGIFSKFKKTAINFHYEFNIRHISNIFSGVLRSTPNIFQDKDKVVKLWLHESERIYCDRLVSEDHIKEYKNIAFEIVKKSFPTFGLTKYFQKQGDTIEQLIFNNFGASNDGNYDIMAQDKAKATVEEKLAEYNQDIEMDLVLFQDAISHVCRITRIISMTGGHALLVGVGGSGKQSLTKLSAFICELTPYSIQVNSSYGMLQLKENLITLYEKCGQKDEGILFLITDSHITNEQFLVYINDLLASGEIADLYTEDDKTTIIGNIRNKVKSERGNDSPDECWKWYIEKVKERLHVTLCFSPVGDTFRTRARRFPGLVNCTVIDWFHDWPEDALLDVASDKLKDTELELTDESIRKTIIEFMPYSFIKSKLIATHAYTQERRKIYSTPKSFLELIKLYKGMLKIKNDQVMESIENYHLGLDKLEETEEKVQQLEIDLKVMQVDVDAKKEAAAEKEKIVAAEKAIVEVKANAANLEEQKCITIQNDVSAQKQSCEAEVKLLEPIVQEAVANLTTLDKKDLSNLKALKKPPDGLAPVFYSIMYMFCGVPGFDDDIAKKNNMPSELDWQKGCLRLLLNPDKLIQRMEQFPKQIELGNARPQNFEAMRKYMKEDAMKDPKIMAKKSGAAASVLVFVTYMLSYYDAMTQMIPKREALIEAEKQLSAAESKLAEVKEEVRILQEKLDVLQAEYDIARETKESAEAQAQACADKLNLATRLITALSSEKIRWAQNSQQLERDIVLLPGDVLLASAFISYAGPFSKGFRDTLVKDNFLHYLNKKKMAMSENPEPVNILVDDATIAEWSNYSLPADEVSIQNGTILTNTKKYPLIIDPQLQGINFIKNMEEQRGLITIRLTQKGYEKKLERAIVSGTPVLVENLDDHIDPMIFPIIARQTIIKNFKQYLVFQGENFLLDPNFFLYMHTKLSNPSYPPEIQAEAALINFTVTELGLADQLLSMIVGKERPDLARKKIFLITQQNTFRITLRQLEKDLLTKLVEVENALEDKELILNLEEGKRLSVEIGEKVEIAQKTEAMIDKTSSEYKPSARRGALIFFLMNELFRLSSFYMYSLESFVDVMDRAVNVVSKELGKLSDEPEIPMKKEAKIVEEENEEEEGDEEEQEDGSRSKADQEEEEGEEEADETHDKQEEASKKAESQKGEDQPDNKEASQKGEDQEPGNQDENHDETKSRNEEVHAPAPGEEEQQEEAQGAVVSPGTLKKRLVRLTESITYEAMSLVRRGLFERHKLIFVTLLCLRIQEKEGKIESEEVKHLIQGKPHTQMGNMSEKLKSFLREDTWKDCKMLEYIPEFHNIGESFDQHMLQWKKWFDEEKAEQTDPPMNFKEISKFHKLMLIKCMRLDRLTLALKNYVIEELGEEYIEQEPFNMEQVYEQSGPQTPIFFVLFPGVDPTNDVENLGKKFDYHMGGKLENISMGQGQELKAIAAMKKAAKKGTWIFLQNVHLMQSWLKIFERTLEEVALTAKPMFRCFISSEPPPVLLPLKALIPESILQRCIKISNEAPSDLKANMRRAYSHFSQDMIDKSTKKNEYKSILFALCYFHSVVLGRKKFGAPGWSKIYNFNDGDLTICAQVLNNYLESQTNVPYDDLKYIYGDIMYGGHITDDWDRRTNRTYLKVLIKPDLLQNMNLIPAQSLVWRIPNPANTEYEGYQKFIEKLPVESPLMFGMHPNAEINFLTQQADIVLDAIINISGGGGGADAGVENEMLRLVDQYKGDLPESFNLIELREIMGDNPQPFEIVCLQETERMNTMLKSIETSLDELAMGLKGELNMTDAMEELATNLQLQRVPPAWGMYYMSKKTLNPWYEDLGKRCTQLRKWSEHCKLPIPLTISWLFNPMSFLTAIMQITARVKNLPLDNMCLQTNITSMMKDSDIQGPPETGAYISGMFLEGASWDQGAGGNTGSEGWLAPQKPKELHPILPIVQVVAVEIQNKLSKGQYQCPVYYTTMRGPTYVFTANLAMENEDSDDSIWILSGTAIIMNDD